MALILPRLRLSDATVAKLRRESDRRGVNVADIIAELVERQVGNPGAEDETLYRIILVGERYGLSVGGTRLFPAGWKDVGRIAEATCRSLADSYIAWRRRQHEIQQGVG